MFRLEGDVSKRSLKVLIDMSLHISNKWNNSQNNKCRGNAVGLFKIKGSAEITNDRKQKVTVR